MFYRTRLRCAIIVWRKLVAGNSQKLFTEHKKIQECDLWENKEQTNRGERRKKKGDLLLTLALIAAIAVFCFAAYNLFHIYTEYKKGTDEYNHIEQMAVTDRAPEDEELVDAVSEPKPPISVDFDTLKSVNPDVVGWIYIEALDNINYPVVQGDDNETYLHTTYENNYNFAGTIFVDYENSSDFSDCNTLIYGHNMKKRFHVWKSEKNLQRISPPMKKSKYFWILTPEKNYRYEIISAYTTGVNSDTYTLFKGPGGRIPELPEYDSGIFRELKQKPLSLRSRTKLLHFPTCTGNEATRFVVQGKQVNAEPAG